MQNDSESELYWDPGRSADDIFNQMSKGKYIEIPLSTVKKERKLGEGEFGEVFKGEWTTPTTTLTVALKTLKSSASEEERLKLLQEAAIMGQFIHPHIVRLYGVVTLSEPVSILVYKPPIWLCMMKPYVAAGCVLGLEHCPAHHRLGGNHCLVCLRPHGTAS